MTMAQGFQPLPEQVSTYPIGEFGLPIFEDDYPVINTSGITRPEQFRGVVGTADWAIRPIVAHDITPEVMLHGPHIQRLPVSDCVEIARQEFERLENDYHIPVVPHQYGWLPLERYPYSSEEYESPTIVSPYSLAAIVQVLPAVKGQGDWSSSGDLTNAKIACRKRALDYLHSPHDAPAYKLWDILKGSQYVTAMGPPDARPTITLVDLDARLRLASTIQAPKRRDS